MDGLARFPTANSGRNYVGDLVQTTSRRSFKQNCGIEVEPLAEVHRDVRKLMTLAYPGEGNSSLCEQTAKDYFIASLADRDLELKIREREPRNLQTCSSFGGV